MPGLNSNLLSTLHSGARDAIKLSRFGRNGAQESLKFFFKKCILGVDNF